MLRKKLVCVILNLLRVGNGRSDLNCKDSHAVINMTDLSPYKVTPQSCDAKDGSCNSNVQRVVSEAYFQEEVPPPRPDTNRQLNELDYGEDMGVKQVIDPTYANEIQKVLKDARSYLETIIFAEKKYRALRDECKNKHENCAFWSALGECKNNPGYMNVSCAPVCQACEYMLIENRCPLDPNAVNAWYPGSVNTMFERIITSPEYVKYEPKVLSRPEYVNGDTSENATYQLGPWMLVMENFVSESEARRLIELGGIEGYERSSDVGALKFDGTFDNNVNEGRTSENAWCQKDCYNDPMAKAVMDRITNVTTIPEPNSEYLQLLRYEVGQFYQTHHDLISHQLTRQPGVRLLTVYIYLNDVEEGGGTNFPHLGLTVTPKLGRVVLWPSVLNEDPNQIDHRTEHQALPVIKGVKYGANAWIHQRDFKTPNANGCS